MKQREIKFRAWHIDSKVMFNVLAIAFQNKQIVVKWHGAERAIDIKQFVLMQYTGLNDKNGVEIFEGDVLSYDYSDSKDLAEWMLKPHYVVTYERDYFICGIDVKPERKLFAHPFRFKNCELLGNIYQHPELVTS